jgi:uncharacterized membrane protein
MPDDSRIYAAGAYLCFVLSGIFVYIVREKDAYSRFHAMQSMLFTAALFIVSFILGAIQLTVRLIPGAGSVLGLLIGLAGLFVALAAVALWLALMFKAYSGERYRLPFIGELAARMASAGG